MPLPVPSGKATGRQFRHCASNVENSQARTPTTLIIGGFALYDMPMIGRLVCMLDIIWNVVEDDYLTIIMYLLCSIPMRFFGKTSQMIHNERNDVRSRTAYLEATYVSGPFEQSPTWRIAVCPADRLCLEFHGRDSVRPG